MGEPKQMKDGSTAYLTNSGNYYCRREPSVDEWDRIRYWTLGGDPIPTAMAQCGSCGDIIESKHCGNFVMCGCGKSYVDTDRWFPEMHRYGGHAMTIKLAKDHPLNTKQ